MITKITIENFKGIRNRVELNLKPITLMFGANSAGKSTIIHALHYASEVFLRRNYDADRTARGGEFVDLGGFRNFLHTHPDSHAITLAFELDLSNTDLPIYELGGSAASPPFDISGRTDRVSVAVELRMGTYNDQPYATKYSVAINGKHAVTFEYDEVRGKQVEITSLIIDHPIFYADEDGETEADAASDGEDRRPSLLDGFGEYLRTAYDGDGLRIGVYGLEDALPVWGEAIDLGVDVGGHSRTEKQQELFEDRRREHAQASLFDLEAADRTVQLAYYQAVHSLSQVAVGVGQLLGEALEGLRFIGPLRTTPPRNYSPSRYPDERRWADGLAAWDALFRDYRLAELTSEWLSDPERLDAGYSLSVRRIRELSEGTELYAQLSSGRVFEDSEEVPEQILNLPVRTDVVLRTEEGELLPQDVGVGISQLLPVVVAAFADSDRLVTIEQPELHVHPRLQAELGDVLISAAKRGNGNQFLIETHSEHLILRLLSRVRETHESGLPGHLPGVHPNDLSVVYLASTDGTSEATHLRVSEDGDFIDRWPNGFFEERAEELF